MRVHFDVLSKKPRTETVEVIADELSPQDSPVVRVTFREIPETEFETLQAVFSGALAQLGRVLEETRALELKMSADLPYERAAAFLLSQKAQRKAYQVAQEGVKEIRREIVSKCVVGHNSEDFEIGPLPLTADDPEAEEAIREYLLDVGWPKEDIDALLPITGNVTLRATHRAMSWTYGEGAKARELPGTAPATIRLYERSLPGGALLNSLCNAAMYWHRLALKTPTETREEARRLSSERVKQDAKVAVLLSHGLIKPERASELKTLDPQAFEVLTRVVTDLADLAPARPLAASQVPPLDPQRG